MKLKEQKTFVLTPEIKNQWVEALRSGKYKMGKVFLKVEKQDACYHCALGVLLEEIGLEARAYFDDEVEGNVFEFQFLDKTQIIDMDSLQYKDFEDWSESVIPSSGYLRTALDNCGIDFRAVARKNDDCNSTFEDVANLIEDYYREPKT